MTVASSKHENPRVVSGMRVTGRMHLGNYHGALKNWLQLQHKYDCYFFAADWHALTTNYEHSAGIAAQSRLMIQDWLAAGLDPKAAKIFIQSGVPEHAELHLLLSMITPLSWLERVPTYKDQQEKLNDKDLSTYGFLGYPLLQTADILIYKPKFVPVGEDQVAHVELTREVARRFNHIYGNSTAILPEPAVLLTKESKFPGLDGQKMSKSYHNTIELTEDPASVTTKIKRMKTDPARVHRTDPGEPEKCPVWSLHKIYSSEEVKDWVVKGCRSAGIGCLECKAPLIESIIAEQKPIIERSKYFAANPQIVQSIIAEGTEQARDCAKQTLQQVRIAMGIAE
jgi:tryptophanyl-tRNA synthetase